MPDVAPLRSLWLLLALLPWLAGCSGEPESPEARLRALVATAEQAVEAGSLKRAAPLVAAGYRDERGNDRRTIVRLLFGYLQRHRNIHLLTRIADIQLGPQPDQAAMRLYVAMSGTPIASLDALDGGARADLYRFDLQLVDGEDGWQVSAASWRRARLSELLD